MSILDRICGRMSRKELSQYADRWMADCQKFVKKYEEAKKEKEALRGELESVDLAWRLELERAQRTIKNLTKDLNETNRRAEGLEKDLAVANEEGAKFDKERNAAGKAFMEQIQALETERDSAFRCIEKMVKTKDSCCQRCGYTKSE